ncbi:hypothetical protein C1646_769764 [Rhizophagus diaphanus]|nr:hypothetical protein C1646_769764 [Rhizophagus diaphanus] [Rhizophagus sp. MUCL 43196]
MGKHRLTVYIEVLNEKANTYNKYALCKACIDKVSREYAYSNKIVNTKKCVKSHLSKYENFFAMYGKEKGLKIIQDTDSETTKANTRMFSGKKRSRTIFEDENYFNNQSSEDEYDSDNESVMTFNSNTTSNTNTTFTSSITLSSKTGITGPLDNFAVRKLSTNQERKWWYLVLKATISNGWSFHWVENKDAQEMFYFLNLKLKLPHRKQLGEKILKDASEDIIKSIETKAKADLVGVTLTIDGWTNVVNQNLLDGVLITSKGEVLVWKAYDISTERSRIAEVKEKIESLTKNVQDAGY